MVVVIGFQITLPNLH